MKQWPTTVVIAAAFPAFQTPVASWLSGSAQLVSDQGISPGQENSTLSEHWPRAMSQHSESVKRVHDACNLTKSGQHNGKGSCTSGKNCQAGSEARLGADLQHHGSHNHECSVLCLHIQHRVALQTSQSFRLHYQSVCKWPILHFGTGW